MEEENVQQEDLNLEEGQNSNSDEQPEADNSETEAELQKAKEIAENQRIRAEKAERKLKELTKAPKEKETPKNEGMSLQDIRALNDVHDDDVEEVTEFAKYKGITIAEAKKHPVITTLLRTRAEERATAQAASTSTNKRSVNTTSEEQLINDFNSGKSIDEKDIDKLVQAQIAQKKKLAKSN